MTNRTKIEMGTKLREEDDQLNESERKKRRRKKNEPRVTKKERIWKLLLHPSVCVVLSSCGL